MDKVTPEQIAHAFGVPPDLIGLLPPDAGETIAQAAFDGTLTGEAYVYADGGVLKDWTPSWVLDQTIHAGDCTGVLPPGECPSNGSPYVPGHLGPTAYLVNQHAPSPHTWEGKTPVQIMADIEKAAQAYKGVTVPKKTFKAKPLDPDNPMSVMAHEVFTSPLIHSPEHAAQTAEKLLGQHVKADGPVKVKQLDEQGNPTGNWITLGQVSDFNFASDLLSPEEFEEMQGWPPEPQTLTLNYPAPKQSSFMQALVEAKLAQAVQAEAAMLGAYLGVDLSKSSGNTATMQSNPVDPGVVQVSVYGPDGEPVVQTTIPMDTIASMAEKAEKMITIDPVQTGMTWNHNWQHPIGTLGDHDYVDLGHEEAFAEAVTQQKKVADLQAKITAKVWENHDDYSDVPEGYYIKEDPEYGEQLVPIPVSTGSDLLFSEEKPKPPQDGAIHPEAHLWCTACGVHWMRHTGDPVACDSGGWLRPSTPLEDKQYLDRIRMLHETGLL